jgi:hypothetical protein
MIEANPSRGLGFGELDDDLDIVTPPLKNVCKDLWPRSSGDQWVQPRTVCPGQRLACPIPVPLVGVDTAYYDVISQDHFSGNIAGAPVTDDRGV